MDTKITIGLEAGSALNAIGLIFNAIRFKEKTPGLIIATREEIERKYPIAERLKDKDEVVALNISNYACTVLFAPEIVDSMGCNDFVYIKETVKNMLINNQNFTLSAVLTNKDSYAAKEAIESKKIINHSLQNNEREKIFESVYNNIQNMIHYETVYQRAYDDKRMNIAFSNVSLPYGIFQVKYKNPQLDHIKVDFYSPYIAHETERLCMLIYRKYNENLYKYFNNEFNEIYKNANKFIVQI